MAFDTFLQIDGIKGESQDDKHKDWIDVLSYSQKITPPAPPVPKPGPAPVTSHEFVITKQVDVASPKLYEACASGKHIAKATIEVWRPTGKTSQKYLTIQMQQVIISSVNASSPSAKDSPTETLTLTYGSVQWTYTKQSPAGSKGTEVTGSFTAA